MCLWSVVVKSKTELNAIEFLLNNEILPSPPVDYEIMAESKERDCYQTRMHTDTDHLLSLSWGP